MIFNVLKTRSWIRYSLLWLPVMSIFSLSSVVAQTREYKIDISKASIAIKNELKLGGTGKAGEKISVNNYYISRNDKPIIAITGEFHFTRYPKQYWEESIKKMKAGGINMIATYVFWNIHEEKEGKFDWSGNKDLRTFVQLCAKNNMDVIVRLGPFCHGEIRNGGLPDWLLSKPFSIRSNDPGYLHYAEVLYSEIGKQLKGLYYKDGGPILGAQIENEFQHSAAPWGLSYPGQPYDFTAADQDKAATHEGVSIANKNNPYATLGNDHMKILKSFAMKAGIEVPIYTATGWGYAAIVPNESLPVTAGYCYPTWTEKKELSPFYLYKNMHQNPDYSPVRYVPTDYPAFAAELGSGIMTTYTRRPIVPANSMDALINRCLGSGANGLGYYMYHGGSTPRGEHYFFNDEAYGYPKISYDFQAPIGEYGQVRPAFHRLKLLHFFINNFAEQLAPMATVLPATNAAIKPDNLTELRYAARAINGSGFLFLNNFQDNIETKDKKGLSITVKTAKGDIRIPAAGTFDLAKEENAILPFNFDMDGANLQYATAQLMLKSDDKQQPYYVFFVPQGVNPEFRFVNANGLSVKNIVGSTVSIKDGYSKVSCAKEGHSEFQVTISGKKIKVLVVGKATALKAYEVNINNKKHLLFSEALVLPTVDGFELQHRGGNGYNIDVYPKITGNIPEISDAKITKEASDPVFTRFHVELPVIDLKAQFTRYGLRKINVVLPQSLPAGINDIFMDIDYVGDTGMGFINNEMVADEFFKGTVWDIGLKQFLLNKNAKEMSFYFRPVGKKASYLVDLDPKLAEQISKSAETLDIKKVCFELEYTSFLKFKK